MNEVDKKRKAVEDKIEELRFESESLMIKGNDMISIRSY